MASSVLEVSITDSEPFKALVNGVAGAAESFGRLTEDERAALPEAARAGIAALIAVAEGSSPRTQPRDLTPYGSVVIEWGPPRGEGRPLQGCMTSICDTATGEPILTVSHIRIVEADANRFVTADLTMFADENGNPSAAPYQRDGEIVTGVFRFNVSEMRVREPETAPRDC